MARCTAINWKERMYQDCRCVGNKTDENNISLSFFLSFLPFIYIVRPIYVDASRFFIPVLLRFTMIPTNQCRAAWDWMYVDARNKYWLDIPRAGLCCTFNKSHLPVSHYVGKWISCGLCGGFYYCYSLFMCGTHDAAVVGTILYSSVVYAVPHVQKLCDNIFALFWPGGKADNYISTDRWPFSFIVHGFRTILYNTLMIY